MVVKVQGHSSRYDMRVLSLEIYSYFGLMKAIDFTKLQEVKSIDCITKCICMWIYKCSPDINYKYHKTALSLDLYCS